MTKRGAKHRGLLMTFVSVAMAACTAATAGPVGGGPGASERIDLRVVPVPATVTGARFPWYSTDGERIVFSGTPAGSERVEILSVREDGSQLQCLTCGVAPEITEPLLKPIGFRDGQRLVVRVGDQTVGQAADHAILECQPSVVQCDEAQLVPVEVPAPGNAVVVQDQREMRPAPDGEHVGFTQVRATGSGEPVMVAIVATLQRDPDRYRLPDARVVSTRGELKSFTRDGQAVFVSAFSPSPYEAANPDVLRVDLASGTETRVTHHLDYDEPLESSPNGRWYVVGSARGAGLFETVAQVRRPPLMGPGLGPLVAALYVQRREAVIEPWLVRSGAEERGVAGRRLNPDSGEGGWDGRVIANWHPDGTSVVFWEGRGAAHTPGQGDTRLVVVHLPDRRSIRHPTAPGATPAATWAPSLEGFVPEDAVMPESRAGRRSGSVTITETPVPGAPGRFVREVTYDGFSDERGWIVDGVERADYQRGISRYTADLTLSGRHDGYLRADATISAGGITGSIESEVDGRRLHLP